MSLSGLTLLPTPQLPCIVRPGVFDAFAWHRSDNLNWLRGPSFDVRARITADNPAGLAFLLAEGASFLPHELAILHVPSLSPPLPDDARMLAPWAIDDATDLLWETRTPPSGVLTLATTSLAALFWGLHDWAHFHNHGPFTERAPTELQCDASALVWLRLGARAGALELDEGAWERVRLDVVDMAVERHALEGLRFDPSCLAADALLTLESAAAR